MNPFDSLPERQIWSRAFAPGSKLGEIGTYATPLIRKSGAIASVGTALAAQLTAILAANGFASIRTEERHPALAGIPAETEDYEAFSAGYGEVHSVRELLQLVRRCTRKFAPKEDRWREGDRVVDPFRPGLIYAARSDREFDLLTEKHLNAVRSAFRRCETLMVALSASEICESIVDGAVFPAWPGAVAGMFDPERHAFRTLTIEDTTADLRAAFAELRAINPAMRIVLMVSPEPMEATAMPAHVAAESLYGKAILRVAMDLASYEDGVSYFPAWEITEAMGAAAFGADGRTLAPEALDRVTSALLDVCEGGTVEMAAPARAALPSTKVSVPFANVPPAGQPGAVTEAAVPPERRKPGVKLKVIDEITIAEESQERHLAAKKKGSGKPRAPRPVREPKPRKEPKPKSRRAREEATAAAVAAGLPPENIPPVTKPRKEPNPRSRSARETAAARSVDPAASAAPSENSNQRTPSAQRRRRDADPKVEAITPRDPQRNARKGRTPTTAALPSNVDGARKRRSLKSLTETSAATAARKRSRNQGKDDDKRRWWEKDPKG